MLRRLYDWVIRAAESPQAMKWLAAISFIESSVFPIPPDAMLIPMVIARPRHAWTIAGVCTIASVIGGLFGYLIGYALFETVGRWILDLYNYNDAFEQFRIRFDELGIWAVAIAGFTPFPYKVITIASGVAHFDIFLFVLASIVSRAGRFFLVAALLRYFGPPIRTFIERYLNAVTVVFVLLLIAGFAAVTYL